MRRCLAFALLAGAALSMPARAVEYQVHGYAAQGLVYTDENNFFGESSDVSTDYYEAGLNGSIQAQPNLLFSAQVAIRDAGISDDGSLRLDYALAEYRFVSDVDTSAGIRVGKVKNSLGFFNETRDVIFTRPGILMPGVYADNQNQRSLIFTGPGAQVFATRVAGRHEFSFSGTANVHRNVRKNDERLLITLPGIPFDLRIENVWNARVMDSIDGGRLQFALSHFHGRFRLATADDIGLTGAFGVGITVLSARLNAEKFSLTTEYSRITNHNELDLGAMPLLRQEVDADSGYVQADFRFNKSWSAFARFDASFSDIHDRSGRKFEAANPGADRKSRMTRDLVAGVSWKYGEHWGFWGEYHWIDGTSTLQMLENPVPPGVEDRWSMLMFMAGFKF
jgi:hypothetical protein